MMLSFHPCFVADEQIVLAVRSLGADDHELIRRAEAIILPQARSRELYEACSRSSARVFPNYEMRFKYPGKVGQSRLFELLGCPHPETSYWPSVEEFLKAFPGPDRFPHELPFLIKENKSHEAEGVYLVKGNTSLAEALNHISRKKNPGMSGLITQAYVPCGGNVLRTVLIGKRVCTYWKRPGQPEEIITTLRKGAVLDHHWRQDLQERGKAMAHTLSEKTGINLAAIDFVFPLTEKDPHPLFLEINYYFGRRGLGGTERYYHLLYQAIREWLADTGLNPESVSLV
jgi:ribosomal protein S6--L-glutamate ligase